MSEPRSRVRPLLASVRFRTTAFAVIVVGVVMALSVVALRMAAETRLEASITEAAEIRAADLAALVEAGGAQGVLSGRGGQQFAQIVDPSGSVVAFSPGYEGLAPAVDEPVSPGESVALMVDELFDDGGDEAEDDDDDIGDVDGPYAVVVRGASGPDGPVTVIAGASLEPVRRTLGVLGTLLWGGLPVVLLIVGGVVWYLTGQALRPIDAMREEADSISASDLGRRLPEPASRDEVYRLASTLNDMLVRLEASAERQRQFVADASHELKTPVAAIRVMLEVAAADPHFSDWESLVGDLGRENRRSEELVRDLLMLAAVDAGRVVQQQVEVDLDRILGQQADVARAGSNLTVDASGLAAARVLGDPTALETMARNLVDNARRHAAATVWLEMRVEDGTAVIEISDDGPGIPAGDRERVFERFVRLDMDRSRGVGGTGLGLAVARAVARSHGGDIAVVEPRHSGATLRVWMPSVE